MDTRLHCVWAALVVWMESGSMKLLLVAGPLQHTGNAVVVGTCLKSSVSYYLLYWHMLGLYGPSTGIAAGVCEVQLLR